MPPVAGPLATDRFEETPGRLHKRRPAGGVLGKRPGDAIGVVGWVTEVLDRSEFLNLLRYQALLLELFRRTMGVFCEGFPQVASREHWKRRAKTLTRLSRGDELPGQHGPWIEYISNMLR